MYPRYTLKYPPTLLSSVKNLPKRAQREFKNQLLRTVKPQIQRNVDDLLGEEAPPVQYPFVFSDDPAQNARIRAAYFATNGFGKGIPYKRTGSLPTSWRVDVSTRLQQNFIVISNPKSYAKYVYPGAKQVPGHRNTGWGKDFDTAIALINEDAVILVKDTWRNAILKVLESR
jgi:hypothetical protein